MKPLFRRPSIWGSATGVMIAVLSVYKLNNIEFGASLRGPRALQLWAYDKLSRSLGMQKTSGNYQTIALLMVFHGNPPSEIMPHNFSYFALLPDGTLQC
jgi:hypothetical protein